MSTEIRKALVEERRRRFLENLIGEAIVNVLAEQDQPAEPAPAATAPPPPPPPAASPPPAVTDQSASPEQPFTVDDMIERLNVIRGGRSFTDPEVYGRLVTYFKTLDDGARESLEKFLVELGKIVIDVGQEAQKPQEPSVPAEPVAPPAPAPSAPPAQQTPPIATT